MQTTITRQSQNKALIALFAMLFFSCGGRDIFFEYKSLPVSGWHQDSIVRFEFQVDDTLSDYNVYVNLRNRSEYPYQNFWFFSKSLAPDSVISADSVECYLADKRGKWLGSGIGSTYEMPVLYQQKKRFLRKGLQHFELKHGMRDSILVGISDIGLRIEKCE